MHGPEIILGLLVLVASLAWVAARLRVPYPILLVVGGLLLGFAPGVPDVTMPPDVVLIGILPPLLYVQAYFTGLRELRRNIRPISLLALGVVVLTTAGVAWVAHMATDLPWAEAFVLGAIVAPTDPTASSAIAERLGLPTRLVALIEGESLVNDGTALVAYRFAVAAVVTGSFSLFDASWHFVLNVVGGIVVGLVVGYLIRRLRRRLDNPPVEIAIALLSGYLGYLPAQALGVSGVLAAVTVGIYMGIHTPELTTVQTRLQGQAVWEIVFLLLNDDFTQDLAEREFAHGLGLANPFAIVFDRDAFMKLTSDRDEKLKKVLTEADFKKFKEEIEPAMRPQRRQGGGPR